MKLKYRIFILSLSPLLCFSQIYIIDISLINGNKIQLLVDDIENIGISGTLDIHHAEELVNIINSLTLKHNYPNPFNITTSIEYEIPCDGIVKLSIYDLEGKYINTLVNSRQQQGKYIYKWNGNNQLGVKVSSGYYFYSLQFDNRNITRGMILLK